VNVWFPPEAVVGRPDISGCNRENEGCARRSFRSKRGTLANIAARTDRLVVASVAAATAIASPD
jgi:hypothetical protein